MNKKNIWGLLIILILSSCSMKQEILLERSGEGRVSFEIGMASYLGEVIEQLGMLLDPEADLPEEDESFFDLAAIEEGFSGNGNLRDIELQTPDRLSLNGSFRFSSVEAMLADMEKASPHNKLISFSEDGRGSRLSVSLTRDSISALLEANPALNNPLVENFGPAATVGLTPEDYLDMMEFALGEESRMGIQNSKLSITIRVAGEIISQEGGTQLSSSAVRYDIPLLDILILDKNLTYTLSYR